MLTLPQDSSGVNSARLYSKSSALIKSGKKAYAWAQRKSLKHQCQHTLTSPVFVSDLHSLCRLAPPWGQGVLKASPKGQSSKKIFDLVEVKNVRESFANFQTGTKSRATVLRLRPRRKVWCIRHVFGPKSDWLSKYATSRSEFGKLTKLSRCKVVTELMLGLGTL